MTAQPREEKGLAWRVRAAQQVFSWRAGEGSASIGAAERELGVNQAPHLLRGCRAASARR